MKLAASLVFFLVGVAPAASAATGTLRGVVLAERSSRAGRPQILIAAPTGLADRPIDEIRLELPKGFRGGLTPDLLPKGWTLDVRGRLARLQGPALAPGGALAVALGKADGGRVGEVGLSLLGGGKELLAGQGTPAALVAAATSGAVAEVLRLPRAAAPGETIDFSPLDGNATPPGGAWEIDGATVTWNGLFDGAGYQWTVPLSAKVGRDLELHVRYTDPWGETLVDGTWDETHCGPPADPAVGPRVTGCSPKMLSNGTLCVCGTFPSGSRSHLRVNGEPLGEPVSASSQALHFFLPEGVAPGPFTVVGDAAAGFAPSDRASGINIAVQGEIDRSRLMRGESTPLRLWLEGTEEPLSLRLWNTTTSIVSLAGGEDQVVTTSGGQPNRVERTVNAVSAGDFVINFSLTIDSCPCGAPAAAPGPTTVATTTRPPLAGSARGPCDESRAACEELRLRAEALAEAARSARRAADQAAADRAGFDPATLEQGAERDRAQVEILRRQAREWRELAAAARASAATNRERHRKYPGYGWDYWAARDEEEAQRRDAEAEKLEREARDLEADAKEQSDRARQLRDAATQAAQAAVAAEAAAAAARAAYDACVARLATICPGPAVGTTTRPTPGPTTTPGTTGAGDDPRDETPPTVYGEEIDEEKVCPQRGGKHPSCVALIIDLAKNDDWRPGSVTDTKEHLESIQCDVDYVEPTFRTVPPRSYRVEREIWSWSDMEFKKVSYVVNTSAQREAARFVNRGQKAQVTQAIERHRAKLRRGAILAFEMVNGHGSMKGVGDCGRFGPTPDWANNSFDRVEFYKGNYDAAKGNVCLWYVSELTCYSHATARMVDNLNNTGNASCHAASTQNRSFHAGYESDIAHTCSKKGLIEACANYDIMYLADDIDDVIEDEASRQGRPGYGPKTAFKDAAGDLRDAANSAIFSFSTYADQGYEMCVPESHTHRGPY